MCQTLDQLIILSINVALGGSSICRPRIQFLLDSLPPEQHVILQPLYDAVRFSTSANFSLTLANFQTALFGFAYPPRKSEFDFLGLIFSDSDGTGGIADDILYAGFIASLVLFIDNFDTLVATASIFGAAGNIADFGIDAILKTLASFTLAFVLGIEAPVTTEAFYIQLTSQVQSMQALSGVALQCAFDQFQDTLTAAYGCFGEVAPHPAP